MKTFSTDGIEFLVNIATSLVQPNDKPTENNIRVLSGKLYHNYYRKADNRSNNKTTYFSQIENYRYGNIFEKPYEFEKRWAPNYGNSNTVFSYNGKEYWNGSRMSIQLKISSKKDGMLTARRFVWLSNWFKVGRNVNSHWKFPITYSIGSSLEDVVMYFERALTNEELNFLIMGFDVHGIEPDNTNYKGIYGMVKLANGVYYATQPNEHKMVHKESGFLSILSSGATLFNDGALSHGGTLCNCVAAAVLLYNNGFNHVKYDHHLSCKKLVIKMMELTHENVGGEKKIAKDDYLVSK